MSEVIETRTEVTRRIFNERLHFDSPAAAERVKRQLLSLGAIPAIDYYEPADCHVLWWMQDPSGTISVRPGLSHYFESRSATRRFESDVERELVTRLKRAGEKVKTQVRCNGGVIDILTDRAVYEVEYRLTRAKIFEAVGQVLIYRAAIGGERHPVIAGIETSDTARLLPYIKSLGIEVELL